MTPSSKINIKKPENLFTPKRLSRNPTRSRVYRIDVYPQYHNVPSADRHAVLSQGLVTQKARTVSLSTKRYLLKRPAPGKFPQSKVLSLSLFVLRVLTDYSDGSLSFNDLAFFANRFYGRPDLHCISLLSKKVRLSLYHLFFYFASII